MARHRFCRCLLPALALLVLGVCLGGAALPHLHSHDRPRHDDCGACQWWTLLSAALLGAVTVGLAPPRPAGDAPAPSWPRSGWATVPGLPSRAPPA